MLFSRRFVLSSRAYPLQRLLQQRQVCAWRAEEFGGGLGLMRKMNFTTSSSSSSGGGSKDSNSISNRKSSGSSIDGNSSSSSEQVLDSKVSEFIQKVVDENDIVVFMKGTVNQPMCGFSRLAVKILHVNNVPRITSVNVLEADELRDGIKQFSKWPTIPQVFIKGEFVGGSDILMSMHQSGELKTLLADKGIDCSVKPDNQE